MNVVFHERYKEVYASDPAAAYGRMDCIVAELQGEFTFTVPVPAREDDVRLVHQAAHIERVKQRGQIYEMALLAAGGGILAAELAMGGESAFGLVRPPGHHASPGSSWGFCWFNNVAVAVEKLRVAGRIKKALIVDFDLHYGDGTANIFAKVPEVVYHHVEGHNRQVFLDDLKEFLDAQAECDLVAVSAGFDRHEKDWGGLLTTEDYTAIGKILREYAAAVCGGRLFAVLEGGYNHDVLGKNVKAFLNGIA
ncbi:MAG: histone deacetylase family protein [Armatimonadetes bacterium]|nr:histone deacetylase family protein [Armatimonadota bacterium]